MKKFNVTFDWSNGHTHSILSNFTVADYENDAITNTMQYLTTQIDHNQRSKADFYTQTVEIFEIINDTLLETYSNFKAEEIKGV